MSSRIARWRTPMLMVLWIAIMIWGFTTLALTATLWLGPGLDAKGKRSGGEGSPKPPDAA